MALSTLEERYYESIQIDPGKVGDVIGTGTQNRVRLLLGEDGAINGVIKTPIAHISTDTWELACSIITRQTYDAAQRELETCERYFENFLIPTHVVSDAHAEKFAIIQTYLPFTAITLDRVHEENISEQLYQFFNCNGKLIRDTHLFADVMGVNWRKIPGLLLGNPYFENLVLDERGYVRMIDTGLFDCRKMYPQYCAQSYNASLYGYSFSGKQ